MSDTERVSTRAALRRDLERLRATKTRPKPWFVIEALLFDNGFQAVVLYRLSHAVRRRGIPVIGPLLGRLGVFLTSAEIAPGATFGPGLLISHGQAIVVGQWTVVGRDCHLHQGVTLGAKDVGRIDAMPRVGDGVVIGAGAKIIGGVTLGDGALVGPNAFVVADVPAGGKALAPFAEIRPPKAAET
ncbi:MAG: serine O-acetyltransferase [Acidobacteriota bacterium]